MPRAIPRKRGKIDVVPETIWDRFQETGPLQYAKYPVRLIFDSRISLFAKVVMAYLSSVRRGRRVCISVRTIANRMRVNKDTACRAMRQLRHYKQIRVVGRNGRNGAYTYELRSPVFDPNHAKWKNKDEDGDEKQT